MEIRVEGEAERELPPEVAVLHVNLEVEGTHRERVVRSLGVLSREFAEALTPLEPSAITAWSLEPVQVHAWTTGRRGGTTRCSASARGTITFHDLQALADFCLAWAEREGVELEGTSWELTPETEERLETELLTDAVHRARRRAEIMAAASGAEVTSCRELSDHWRDSPGMKGEPLMAVAAASLRKRSDVAPEARPEDIRRAVTVHAVFEAR
ncbi:SIMPL domain-containing protein [Arachnia propionica]|uniref:SIMPL domain-containing protein n=1 Tax=Arachnia propionica TaxID=1750 RepID=A0A3P1T5D3_9ACTN|nr:SIMPL domain-containing protein [Arachnia propionica]RRD04579.1 SIMPL domain-containing protein [Arachnia propionica]